MPAKTILIFLLALTLSSCRMQLANRVINGASPSTGTTAQAPADTQSASPLPSRVTVSPSLTPSPIATGTMSLTRTPQTMLLTAVKGNLFIRRGPDLAFNPVSVLMAGQSAPALARDVLGTWVQIPLPANPAKDGWVSIQTDYSVLSGDVMTLPEVTPTDWPDLAFLRNCTFHEMVTDPGGIVIPSLDNFPANEVQVNPGTYRILDTAVDESPEVLKVQLREGSAIDIRTDGDGEHRKCPAP